MTPLAAHEIRARRRPLVIVSFWAARWAVCLLIALPVSDVFQALGAGRSPFGDAGLFEPDALLLSECVRLGVQAFPPALRSFGLLFALAACLSLVPLAALYIALGSEGRLECGTWFGRALRYFPRFLLLSGLALLGQALIVLLFVIGHVPLRRILAASLNDRWQESCVVAWFVLAFAGVCGVGMIHDLARASSIRNALAASHAIREALKRFSRRSWRTVAHWLLVALASLAALTLAAIAVDHLHIERAGTWRVALSVLVHQSAALTLVALRARWLAYTLRLVSE
jgi:hypothetical protein